ncbi:MAG: hypothetical protein CMP67_05770 [Flavobacteriales bacterium]|nr:hypothetical protein [Flavobacteriales bacterium]|tara:strand:- start:2194 stop:6330 length:4137 start_codon:yes stop_codon:yes gene_type:complete
MTLRLTYLIFLIFLSENLFGQFIINGSALHSGNGDYLLTPAQGAKAGSIWYEEKISLEESFELNFELYFGTKDNGADGITFCLQPLSNNVGVSGGGLGVQGVQPSFFVEFDTYRNGGDPSYDHLALQKNGNVQNNGNNNLFAATHIKAGQNNVENGQWYPMRAIWDAATKRFQLFVDCNMRIDYTGDIVNEIFNGDPMVFWGFTASTGGANNEHRVRNVRSTLLDIDDKTTCRGEGVQLQIPATSSSFSWNPTTGIDDVNSLTPTFTPAQTTEYIISYDGFCNTQLNDTILIVVDNCGCEDFDLDGVCDDIDLDDDNDGILDDIECPTAQVSTTFETSNGATTTFNAPAADKGFQFNIYQLDNSFNLNVNGVDLVPGEIQCQGTGSTGESQLVFLSDNSGYGQAGNDNIWLIQGTKASPVIQLNIDKDGVVSFLGKRNTGAVLEPMRLRLGQPQPQNLTWNVNGANVVVLSQRVSGPTNISGEGFGVITCSEDTDGDGVLNYLDTDSDGDGCFDALEGGDSFEEADLSGEVLIGGVDANGVPIIANGGQDKGSSANSNVASSVCKEPLCGGDINFNLWNQSGLKSEGNWVVASDGKSVNQTINGAPTFFIGEKDYLNVNFSGKMRTDNGDDDWIGMVFGFQSLELKENYPITLKTYVFSWKQRNQGSWEEGFSLYEVNGTFNSRSELENAFRNPSSGSGFLASEFGNNLGYQTGQDYEISISYTSTKITVYVNGVLVLEKNGCFDPGKIGFFNDSQPNVTYSDFKYQFVGNIDISKDTLCLGDEVEVAVYDGPSCGSENYYPQGTLFEWDLRDGTLSNQNKFIYEYLDTGAYDIRLVVSDGIGCSDTSYRKLYVSDYPTKSLPIDTTVCLGDHFLLDAQNDGSDYLWNMGQTTQSIEVTNSGEYSVEIVNWGKCITKDTTSIVFDSVPVVDLGDDIQICQGNSVSLDAQNSELDFLWNTGDTSQEIEVFSSGIFGVEAINSNGCIGSDSILVKINPLPIVRLGNDTVLCSGQIYLLNAENQGANYLWSSGESSQTISVSEVGEYIVFVTDDNGCSSSDTVEVAFNELPEVYLGEDTTICEYQSIILNAQNEGLYFSWNDGSELQSIEVSDNGLYAVEVRDSIGCLGTGEIYITKEILPDPFLKKEYQICEGTSIFLTPDPGYESYQIFWENNMQSSKIEAFETGEYISYIQSLHCKDTFVVKVEKIDTPDAEIVDLRGEDKYCFDLESTILKVYSSESNLDYDWNGLSRDEDLEIIEEGTYQVYVTNDYCKSSYEYSIKEYCEGKLYLPNSFTPNNDGLNDYFTPVINEYITNYDFRIYNRWGELIFQTTQMNQGWDGRVNSQIAEIDAYVYKIRYQYLSETGGAKNESLVGTVLLMR